MGNNLIYVGEYDVLRDGKQKRMYSLAAAKKMDYIVRELNSLEYQVNIVSYAQINRDGDIGNWTEREELSPNCTLSLAPPYSATTKLQKLVRRFKTEWWLFSYLVKNCSRNDKILVYHSYQPAIPIYFASIFKRLYVLLEIEEKYSMVWKLSPWQKFKENIMLKYAKGSALVVSEVLAQKLGIHDPIISYGSYKTFQGELPRKECNKENVILIYTGSIDKTRGSAFLSCETMRYLSEKYVLRISGPVNNADAEDFFSLVNQVNTEKGYEAIKYLGILNDMDYEQLLLTSDIALNPQKEGGFGCYLFPSKILTYMSYGLPVVSTRGESIVYSQLSDLITFSDAFDPCSVAAAVNSVENKDPKIFIDRLEELGSSFRKGLKEKLVSCPETALEEK